MKATFLILLSFISASLILSGPSVLAGGACCAVGSKAAKDTAAKTVIAEEVDADAEEQTANKT